MVNPNRFWRGQSGGSPCAAASSNHLAIIPGKSAEKLSPEIHVHETVPVFFTCVEDGFREHQAGVVDQDVQASVLTNGAVHEPVDGSGV